MESQNARNRLSQFFPSSFAKAGTFLKMSFAWCFGYLNGWWGGEVKGRMMVFGGVLKFVVKAINDHSH